MEQAKALARLEQSAIDSLRRLTEYVDSSQGEHGRLWKAIRSMRPPMTRKAQAGWATLLASLATAAAAVLSKLFS